MYQSRSAQAGHSKQSSRTITYKWASDDGGAFAGDAVVSWMRTGGCERTTSADGHDTHYWPTGELPKVELQPRITNGVSTGDFINPKATTPDNSYIYWRFGHRNKCDARAKLVFEIVKGKGSPMKLVLQVMSVRPYPASFHHILFSPLSAPSLRLANFFFALTRTFSFFFIIS